MKIPYSKQIINTAQDLVKRGSDLLHTKPFEIHGINPKLTIIETGKEIELPRFISPEMQTARSMNRIALRQSKTGIERTFSKAIPEDLRRLTSTSIEDSYSRVEWTNPKDGKIYHLLKQGETEDGKVIVRILDQEGAFIKEAELTPKVIAIPDYFEDFNKGYCGMPHGEVVMTFARRNNPFATYVPFKITHDDLWKNTELRQVVDYVNKGNHVDYVSGSFSTQLPLGRKKDPFEFSERIRELSPELFDYDDLNKKGVRILLAGGNATKEELPQIAKLSSQQLVTRANVEGVGSLSPKTGKLSEFSASRSSELTQHYEVGEYTPVLTKEGLNITGLAGTDVPFPNRRLKELSQNPLIGKSVDKVKSLKAKIETRIRELEKEKMGLFAQRLPMNELMAKRQKIDDTIHLYNQRKLKLTNYMYGLVQKDGKYTVQLEDITGTSLSAPIRTAKLALNDMMEGII